jgi:hypothetical protein
VKYSADIGEWEDGYVYEFEAKNLKEAIKEAHKELKSQFPDDTRKHVLQISVMDKKSKGKPHKRTVDCFNGKLS